MSLLLKPTVPCGTCVLRGDGKGYVPADGTGSNGVLVVLEAAGESEAEVGRPTVGKAGLYLWSSLARVGLQRDEFRIHNVLSCRPPDNKLAKMPYEQAAIAQCSPLLDATILDMQQRCHDNGKHLTILTLGRIAFKRIMGFNDYHPVMKESYQAYPFWNERYQAWVVAGDHPSYIQRGNHHLLPALQFVAKRAVEIANQGHEIESPTYVLDPVPALFQQWVRDYKKAWQTDPENTFLSYDIETPYKAGKSEDALLSVEDESYIILRCSFAYEPGSAVSVPWSAQYLPMIEELFAHEGVKFGWNSDEYDFPRVVAQMPVGGAQIDAMVAWHVLNSAMPKSLGFVTPFYATGFHMWKHLSGESPALYNAIDALAALRCWQGIMRDLKANGQWEVYNRHILQLNKVLTYMSKKGIARDETLRTEVEGKLTALLDEVDGKMDAVVPIEARKLKVYKKSPKDSAGMILVDGLTKTKVCPRCKALGVKAEHFKSIGKKRLKAGESENPCVGQKAEQWERKSKLWAKALPFKVSLVGLVRYQKVLGHRAIMVKDPDRPGQKKITFDENALKRLQKNYPKDPLYKLIGEQRYLSKLRGTYVGITQEDGTIKGGMPMGADGLGHPTFNHDPKTLRLSCAFFHQLPRPGKPDDPHTWIRNMVVARPGNVLMARDFSGIEAVLVGYEAKSASYIRLAKMDVHSYYTAYALHELDGRVSGNDLPLLSWDDEKLAASLAGIKTEFKLDRNGLYKHLTHAINFGQGPKGAQEKIYKETDVLQPVDKIAKVMETYKELFPEIPTWHNEVRLQADRDGYLRNAFGYVLRFGRVFAWSKENGQWVRKLGDEAEEALAFKPQSNAAGIIKNAMLRLYFNRFEEAGQYLTLQIHDELLLEAPEDKVEVVDRVLQEEMEKLIAELPLPGSYNMGPYLTILTEPKVGFRFGSMS